MPEAPLSDAFLELLNPDARKYAVAASLTAFEARIASTLYDLLARLGIRPGPADRAKHQIVIDTAVLCRRIAEQQFPVIAAPEKKTGLAMLDLNPAARVGVPLDLVRISEMAKIAGVSVATIYQKVRSGQIKAYGTRRLYRVSLSELLPVRTERKTYWPGQFRPGSKRCQGPHDNPAYPKTEGADE